MCINCDEFYVMLLISLSASVPATQSNWVLSRWRHAHASVSKMPKMGRQPSLAHLVAAVQCEFFCAFSLDGSTNQNPLDECGIFLRHHARVRIPCCFRVGAAPKNYKTRHGVYYVRLPALGRILKAKQRPGRILLIL